MRVEGQEAVGDAGAAGAAAGAAESLPRIERPVTERVEVDRVLCLRDGAVLLHRISRKTASKYAPMVCNAARASVASGACLGYARRG